MIEKGVTAARFREASGLAKRFRRFLPTVTPFLSCQRLDGTATIGGMSTMLAAKTEFISTKEAAELIGCTEGRVRTLLGAGTILGQKLNERAWAVRRDSAEKYAKTPQITGRPRLRR